MFKFFPRCTNFKRACNERSLIQTFDIFFIINLKNNLTNLSRWRLLLKFHWPYSGIQEGREKDRNEIVFERAAVSKESIGA